MNSLAKLVSNLHGVYRACGPGPTLAFAASIAGTLPAVARRHTLRDADARMARRAWRFRTQGIEVELEGRLWSGAREMYCRSVYFPDPRFNLEPGTTVLDLGANSGLFSLLAALRGCRAIAVEAQYGFIQEIGALARRHGVAERVALEHALVGGNRGLLATPGALEGASHFDGRQPARLTMSELLARHDLDSVDFLKCDIEGSEFELFDDVAGWLPRVRRIAMEVHSDHGAAASLVRILADAGFEATLRDNLSRRVPDLGRESGYLFALRR